MITREEADRLREDLLKVLDEDAHNAQRLLSRLETISRESGIGAHAALLLILTRLGFDSKAVVTGDVTQIDLPTGQQSGLNNATHILDNVDGIAFTFFTKKDVVRHPLVQRIVAAYEADEIGGE